MKYKIACLDVFDHRIRKLFQSVLSEGFSIEFADSSDLQCQLKLIEDADFIMAAGAAVTEELIRSAKKVKLIQKFGIGYDKIAIDIASELNVPVAIAAGSNAIPVAEMTIGLILSVCRKIAFADRQIRAGHWLDIRPTMSPQCFMLNGKTVGLVGFGNIGKRVAKILQGFEVNIFYYDILKASPTKEAELNAEYRNLDELMKLSDIISIHMPLFPETKNFFNKEKFLAMKPDAILINTARGAIVNEEDLIWALQNGIIGGAGLDVLAVEPPDPDNPLFQMDNVVVTCRVAAGVFNNFGNVAKHAFDNMKKVIANEPLSKEDVVV